MLLWVISYCLAAGILIRLLTTGGDGGPRKNRPSPFMGAAAAAAAATEGFVESAEERDPGDATARNATATATAAATEARAPAAAPGSLVRLARGVDEPDEIKMPLLGLGAADLKRKELETALRGNVAQPADMCDLTHVRNRDELRMACARDMEPDVDPVDGIETIVPVSRPGHRPASAANDRGLVV